MVDWLNPAVSRASLVRRQITPTCPDPALKTAISNSRASSVDAKRQEVVDIVDDLSILRGMDDFWIDRWPEIVRVAMYKGVSLAALQGWEYRRRVPGDWKVALVQAAPDFGQKFSLPELSIASRGNSDLDTSKSLKAAAANGG